MQREEERAYEVMSNNLILLRHLTEIASSKRVFDGNNPKEKFPHLYEQILLFRRNQLNKMATSEDGAQTVGIFHPFLDGVSVSSLTSATVSYFFTILNAMYLITLNPHYLQMICYMQKMWGLN